MVRKIALNALVAALYAGLALLLPATALANYRLTTALYVLVAWNPGLIPGLATGNALAGIPQGPIDMAMGAVVGVITAWTCAKLGPRRAPLAVLVVPTTLVPLWLGWLFQVPYLVVLPALAQGQILSALLGWLLLRVPHMKQLIAR